MNVHTNIIDLAVMGFFVVVLVAAVIVALIWAAKDGAAEHKAARLKKLKNRTPYLIKVLPGTVHEQKRYFRTEAECRNEIEYLKKTNTPYRTFRYDIEIDKYDQVII